MKWFVLIVCLIAGSTASLRAAGDSTNSSKATVATPRRVEVAEFAKLLSQKDVVILDVRTPEEFKAGHIKGAQNIDFLGANFAEAVGKLDKKKPCLVYCAGGGRSAQACKKMSALEFGTLVDLAPGFSGWKRANQPVEK